MDNYRFFKICKLLKICNCIYLNINCFSFLCSHALQVCTNKPIDKFYFWIDSSYLKKKLTITTFTICVHQESMVTTAEIFPHLVDAVLLTTSIVMNTFINVYIGS